MHDYETLGAFYLGKGYDPHRGGVTEDLLLYDAKDLTTHAVCVGMTGSGKTGLCVTLLEEAAIDGIPVIAIDPKGDLGNVALTFPRLRPEDFAPWIDPDAATRAGMTADEYAARTAETWRSGLAEWGQPAARIDRFRKAAEVALYTPGSNAGLPVTVLRSFTAPAAAVVAGAEALRDRIQAAVSGLLALLGIDADPIRSREHILLANILDHAWRQGRDLDVAAVIGEIQKPPFQRVGVFDLDTFYPAADRFELAMRLNNLLASPGFAGWMEGEPLDIASLLHTPRGKPRIAVMSIAHLDDTERMFFVTILLNEVLSWMRAQPGTTSLRAILYMDEVFGYLPPTAMPPSKKPLLTLLKQARAYGLGVVLATQNPVDLDYKGLSNTGTWFLGRLQTERDKRRVLDGLEGAAATSGGSFDRAEMDRMLAGLGKRVFLMNDVHEQAPTLFHSRWALSYLRGPLTRDQIATLSARGKAKAAAAATAATAATAAATAARAGVKPPTAKLPARSEARRPALPPEVDQLWLRTEEEGPEGGHLLYRPAVLASTRLHFVHRSGLDLWRELSLLGALEEKARRVDWDEATLLDEEPETRKRGQAGARYAALPSAAARPRSYATWSKRLASHLYREQTMSLWKAPALKLTSAPGEDERGFRVRAREARRAKRDLAVEKLRRRYAPKLERIRDRIRRAEARVEREQAQARQSKMTAAISLGATVLGALFGRKLASRSNIGRATTTMRGASRIGRQLQDVERAQVEVVEQQRKLRDLEAEFQDAAGDLEAAYAGEVEVEEIQVRPRKSDISVESIALAWTPWRVDAQGVAEPAWE